MILIDDVIVNPEEAPMTPARTPVSLSEMGITVLDSRWGESSIEGTSIRTSLGQRLVDRKGKPTTIELILGVRESQAEKVNLPEAAYILQQVFGSMQERESWLMRVPLLEDFAGPLLYKITGVVSLGDFLGWGRGDQPDVKLILERDPVGYSTEEIESETFSTLTGRHLTYTLPASKGTAKGLKRVRVTNNGTVDWRGLIWAEECMDAPDNLSDPTAALAYEASALTPRGGAVVTAGPTAPVPRAVGAVASGTGAISPGLPAGTEKGDLLVMFAESGGATEGGAATTALTAAGWESPPAPYAAQQKGNTRITVLYRIATGTDPTTTNDTGDHQVARIVGIKAGTYDPTKVFNTAAVGTQAATKAVSIPGGTTTRDNCLIFACASGHLPDAATTAEFGAATNASLSELTERVDNTVTAGDGGALYVATGVKAAKGVYSATTLTAVTEAERGVISLAINAPTYVEHSALTAGWVTILSSEIVGTGHMTHRGPRRMLMRIFDPGATAGNVQLHLIWRALGSSRWVEDNAIVPTYAVGNYSIIDLEVCRPQIATLGNQRWEWRLMARAVSGSGAIRLRDVYPLPTEQYAVLQEPGEPTIAGEPTRPPGTVADDSGVGSVAWSNPSNAKASDGELTSAFLSPGPATSHYLKATNFAFSIPEGATIKGIEVSVRCQTGSAEVQDANARIVKGGAISATQDKAKPLLPANAWSTPLLWRTYGGLADLWGLSWLPSDINASNFGFAFAARSVSSATLAWVDSITTTVAYTELTDENRVCYASRSLEIGSAGASRQHYTDDVWGTVVLDGFPPYDPPAGLEGRPSRGIMIPSQGDLQALPDSGSNPLTSSILCRNGLFFAREAAS